MFFSVFFSRRSFLGSVEQPDRRAARERLGSSPRVVPSPRRALRAPSVRRTSAYVCVSSTPGAKRVAPLVKSGSFRSAARSRTMATGGLERAPAPLGLAERLDAPEWLPDLPDQREVGESSRELPPPKMRSRALVRRLAHVVLPFQARLSARRALAVASPAFPRPRPARARIDPTRVPAGRVFPEEDHHTGRGPVAAHRARITFSPGTSATLAPSSLRCGACRSVAQFFARAERKAIEPQPRKRCRAPSLGTRGFFRFRGFGRTLPNQIPD